MSKRKDKREPKIRRVATANIKESLPKGAAQAALGRVMKAEPDLVALQEWHHPDLLAAYEHDYEWTDAAILPVGIRREVGKITSARLIRTSKDMPGVRATYGMDVEIREHCTGLTHAVLNGHPVAHLDRPQNREAWLQWRTRVDVWVGDNRTKHRWVLGDVNKHNLQIPPLVSCWKGRKLLATIGRVRTIDGVWTEFRARWVRTISNASDHDAVLAIYSGKRKAKR